MHRSVEARINVAVQQCMGLLGGAAPEHVERAKLVAALAHLKQEILGTSGHPRRQGRRIRGL